MTNAGTASRLTARARACLRPILTVTVCLVWAFPSALQGATAADSSVTVEVVPPTVELPDAGEVQALVILRNGSAQTLQGVRFSNFTNAGVKVTGDHEALKALGPNTVATWSLRLARTEERPLPGTVHVRIDYTPSKAGGAQVALGSFEVKDQAAESMDKVAKIEAKTALTSLTDRREGKIYLVITNSSSTKIQVKKISTSAPEFIELTPDFKPEVELGAYGSLTMPVDVKVRGGIQAGKHLLLFDATVNWQKGGTTHSGHLIETREVSFNVLGESEILTALGVPSFLFLPGFLILLTVGMLRSWGFKLAPIGGAEIKFPPEVRSPEFWVLGITLSGLMAYAYPKLGGNNYLDGYTLADVAKVWTISIVAAVVGYGIVLLAGRITQKILRKVYYFSSADNPITVLKKLARHGLGVQLEAVEVTLGDKAVGDKKCEAFSLETQGQASDTCWAAPAIKVTWPDEPDTELQRQVHEQLKAEGDASKLADLLASGAQNKPAKLQVSWVPVASLVGAWQGNRNDVRFLNEKRLFVRE